MQTESQKSVILHTLKDGMVGEDRRFIIELTAADEVEISPVKGKKNLQRF
jgi:G-protein coupled receptor 98